MKTITIMGFNWIALKEIGDKTFLFADDVLYKGFFDKYTNDFEQSKLKTFLNKNFIQKLEDSGFDCSQIANGVWPLTLGQYNIYIKDKFPASEIPWLLRTASPEERQVFAVDTTGDVVEINVDDVCGIRPGFMVDTEYLQRFISENIMEEPPRVEAAAENIDRNSLETTQDTSAVSTTTQDNDNTHIENATEASGVIEVVSVQADATNDDVGIVASTDGEQGVHDITAATTQEAEISKNVVEEDGSPSLSPNTAENNVGASQHKKRRRRRRRKKHANTAPIPSIDNVVLDDNANDLIDIEILDSTNAVVETVVEDDNITIDKTSLTESIVEDVGLVDVEVVETSDIVIVADDEDVANPIFENSSHEINSDNAIEEHEQHMPSDKDKSVAIADENENITGVTSDDAALTAQNDDNTAKEEHVEASAYETSEGKTSEKLISQTTSDKKVLEVATPDKRASEEVLMPAGFELIPVAATTKPVIEKKELKRTNTSTYKENHENLRKGQNLIKNMLGLNSQNNTGLERKSSKMSDIVNYYSEKMQKENANQERATNNNQNGSMDNDVSADKIIENLYLENEQLKNIIIKNNKQIASLKISLIETNAESEMLMEKVDALAKELASFKNK